jgi:excisionase family DNA binding protein
MSDDLTTRPEDDPWMTLAEIAEELRMSPATIRSWVTKGTLRATRAGERKWLVRRSELERVLAGENQIDETNYDSAPPEGGWREMDTIESPLRSPHWSEEARKGVRARSWHGVAETEWRNALQASAMAPPDHGFAGRLLEIATAAARKAAALADLDEEPGPWWARQGAIPNLALSYELRPGGNRPGPAELWASFDATVRALNDAMEAHSAPAEQGALEQLSLVMHEIAEAIVDELEAASAEDGDEAEKGPSGVE